VCRRRGFGAMGEVEEERQRVEDEEEKES